jgi:nitrate reductase gamma subunit
MDTVLLWWVWLAAGLFVVACAWRALKYFRAPMHLRWDLYPVAHEPRRDHGGSYFEEKDWWTKPRAKSLSGEVWFMVEEIFFLKGVRENNLKLWWGSLPFHWGLYILVGVSFGLLVAGLGVSYKPLLVVLVWAGAAGGVMTAVGAFYLLYLRWTDPKLRPYTTPLDKLNLVLLVVLGALCFAVAVVPGGMAGAVRAVGNLLRFRSPEVSALLGAQMAVAALFIFYLPFTRMVHFFSKYFTYHEVRWDDRPMEKGDALERRMMEALNFGVDWSAAHVKTGKTWAEVATTLPEDDDKKK